MSDPNTHSDKVLLSTGKVLTVPSNPEKESSKADDPDSVVIQKFNNVWGSSSGAGSDFLDKYRKQRNVEMARLEEMDKKWREDMENKIFHSQRLYRIQKEAEKTLKRKIKRDKKKKRLASTKHDAKPADTGLDHPASDLKEAGETGDNLLMETNGVYSSDSVLTDPDGAVHKTDETESPESEAARSKLIIVDQSLNDL